jgi:hypothetical protein
MFGDYTHPVVHDLEKPAPNEESAHALATADHELAFSQECHERSVIRQYAHFPIERRCDDRVRFAVEHTRFRADDRDLHHELASFLAFSTASSMPPTM